jgi:hypothetical protein
MPTEPWPCWNCSHRRGPDAAKTYSCGRPVTDRLALWERWNLQNIDPIWRNLGTEKQLRGETSNERPECPFASSEPNAKSPASP